MIIRQFDESMTLKADKQAIKNLYNYIDDKLDLNVKKVSKDDDKKQSSEVAECTKIAIKEMR